MCFNGGMEQLATVIYNKLKTINNIKIYTEYTLENIKKTKTEIEKETETETDIHDIHYEVLLKHKIYL